MSVDVQWGDERETYLLIEFVDTWGWAEFYQALDDVQALLDGVPNTIPLVMDFSKTDHTPRGLLVRLSSLGTDLPANRGHIYFVGLNATMLVLMRALSRSSAMLAKHAKILHDRSAALRDIYTSGSLPAVYLF